MTLVSSVHWLANKTEFGTLEKSLMLLTFINTLETNSIKVFFFFFFLFLHIVLVWKADKGHSAC